MSDTDDAFKRVLECLNSAFIADAGAIHALCCNRVPCNAALADHPTVQVDQPPVYDHGFSVGALGLINGVVESATGRRVAMQWNDGNSVEPPRMIGFVEYIETRDA